MSNPTRSRSSDDATSIVVLPALSDFCEGRPAPLPHAGPAHAGISPAFFSATDHPKRQFLFATNERLSLSLNFVTRTKQTTSFFLFDTNERSQLTNRQSPLATHAFLIAGAKILKTALTPSMPIPNVFLIAGVCTLFSVRAASANAPRFSEHPLTVRSSSHSGMDGSGGADRRSHLATCVSPITTHQSLITNTDSNPS